LTNLLWIIPTFVLAIVAAVRETDVRNNYSEIANVGAFGSAAVSICQYLILQDMEIYFK
jgi:hypothetical protein